MICGRCFRGKHHELLLGDILAANLKKKIGDPLFTGGTVTNVVGIYRGGTGLEAGAVIPPLDQMQHFSPMPGRVTPFQVRLSQRYPAMFRDRMSRARYSPAEALRYE